MQLLLQPRSVEDYKRFLAIKALPRYRIGGGFAFFPDEYIGRLGLTVKQTEPTPYQAWPGLWDYQGAITATAIRKQRYAVFADCGLGKTLIITEFARHASKALPEDKAVLIVSPLMVVSQTIEEVRRFYGDAMHVERVKSHDLPAWLASGGRIGITNYEALNTSVDSGRLGALILDESSIMKSHYGAWGTEAIRLGRGLEWKLACTGTPAPNDRIEYANHAVFLDQFPTVNSFLARYFVNRGQTDNRWELKRHALEPFYRDLSHWAIFLTNPATYGWKDNCQNIPPIHVHIHSVDLTGEQRLLVQDKTGALFVSESGGITSRGTLGQIAKGCYKGNQVATNKPAYIRAMVDSWPDESTIIWCLYNEEQKALERVFPEAASITGDTPHEQRETMIADFKAGRVKVIISKPKILGFGLNLQIATRQIWSGLQDSYEQFYQGVKRSNRYGSTRPLNVHIPVTEIERPMIETVLMKAKRVQRDGEEQEQIFRKAMRHA
jgi:superfamily II DNA or RNA helicase